MLKALRQGYAQAGVKSCLLTFFQPGVDVFYTTPELDTIATMGLSFETGLSALVEALPGSNFNETQTPSLNGDLYIQTASLNVSGLSAAKRTLLRSLSQQRVHALIQDNAGQWWLYGQSRGLRLRFKSDSDAGLSFTLGGLEREPARQVAQALIPGYLTFFN